VSQPDQNKEDRLGERLIREAATDSQEDLMARIIRLMDNVTRNLEIDFDPGTQTQALQQRIIDELDEAIREAALKRRPRRSSGASQRGDKRRMPEEGQGPGEQTSAESGEAGEPGHRTADSAAADRPPVDGDIHELRRTWGHLPMREREEIIQGIGESFLERYRDWIERYYRALQEAEE
jgi:hypothetical protein